MDDQGLDVDALIRVEAPRAVYLTPHHQYPTTVTLSAARRLRLLSWASEHGVALIEDDYDNEYHYDAKPVLPLAASDRTGNVIYIGTLSKVFAPGLRIGWVAAPAPLIANLESRRAMIDAQGSLAAEAAVAELFEDGTLQRHVWRTKRIYAERRDALAEALRTQLGGSLQFAVPKGGLALWAKVDPRLDLDRWVERAAALGVAMSPGRRYTLSRRPSAHLRLGFARHTPEELDEAVRHIAAARPRARARR